MSWLLFALFSNLMYSITNVIDQFIRKNHVKHDISALIIWMSMFFVLWLAIVPFIDISIPPLPQLAAAVLSGFSFILLGWIYFNAISSQEISRVIPMFQLNAVFVLIFSTIFLDEILNIIHYAGFAVMLLAGLIITVEKIGNRLTISKPLLLVLGSSVILAISVVLLKFFFLTETFWNGFFWMNFGAILSTFLILLKPGTFKELKVHLPQLRIPKILLLFILTVIATLLGDLAYLYSINQGPVSLVSVVGSTQIAMLFIITLSLSHFFPKILKEKTDRKTLLTKVLAISLMIIGLILINGGV